MTETKEGWGFPGNSRKAHYYVDGTSLCRKWGFGWWVTADDGKPGPAACAKCRRELDRRNP